jgi:hypothetical protein
MIHMLQQGRKADGVTAIAAPVAPSTLASTSAAEVQQNFSHPTCSTVMPLMRAVSSSWLRTRSAAAAAANVCSAADA